MKLKLTLLALLTLLGPAVAEATCDISSAFTAGQVLTAAQLNTLVTDSESCSNNILNGDAFTGSMSFHSGTDALFYSDTGTTLKASIDAATGHFIGALSMEGFHTNCGISNSGSTLSLHGYDGTALSVGNPCVMGIRSNTAGRTALAYFTANQTITHGAASDSDGNVFGITAAVNWASTMPMFGGVVYDGTTPYITSSRLPYVVTGAAATAFCQKGDTDCDAQLDMIIWTSGLTLASWVNLPVTQMFWFNATYATASSAWTFAVTTKNGFNYNYEGVEFTLPVAQNGAESGKTWTSTDGATALQFTGVNVATYWLNRAGWSTLSHVHDSQSAAGADATGVRWAAACEGEMSAGQFLNGAAQARVNGVGGTGVCYVEDAVSYAKCTYTNSAAEGSLTDSAFANTADNIYFSVFYPCM